jgi:hypothetical protein
LYNYENVDAATMIAARLRANEVFRDAGIALVWVECPISDQDAARIRSCSEVPHESGLILRIIPESMISSTHHGPGVFGVATDVSASVLHHRLRNFAERHEIPTPLVLGTVMAHELGHLLMGDNSHSFIGIMRETFQREDFRGMRAGLLRFTRTQSNCMQAQLRRYRSSKAR